MTSSISLAQVFFYYLDKMPAKIQLEICSRCSPNDFGGIKLLRDQHLLRESLMLCKVWLNLGTLGWYKPFLDAFSFLQVF